MKFFAVAAALVAAVAAQSYGADECSIVTITETVTVPGVHTPTAPGSAAPTIPPYPTGEAPYPSVVPSGTGVPVPSVPAGTAAPSGTGAYTPGTPEFTGAASNLQVGGFVAGVGAFAALFL